MTNSRTRVLKIVQTMLVTQDESFTVSRTLLQDVYELLTEPYQISIEDILIRSIFLTSLLIFIFGNVLGSLANCLLTCSK